MAEVEEHAVELAAEKEMGQLKTQSEDTSTPMELAEASDACHDHRLLLVCLRVAAKCLGGLRAV